MRCSRLCYRLLLIVGALLGAGWTLPAATAASAPLATTVAGDPVIAGDAVVWLDRRDGGSVWSYRRSSGVRRIAHRLGPAVAHLAAHGQRVAWIDGAGSRPRITFYDLQTGLRESRLLPPSAEIADLALDGGAAFLWDHAPARRGIYRLDLRTARLVRIAPVGARSLAGRLMLAGGNLLWSEYGPDGARLWLLAAGTAAAPRLIVAGELEHGGLTGFGLTDGAALYAFEVDRQLWRVDLPTDARAIVAGEVDAPTVGERSVYWSEHDPAAQTSRILTLDLPTGRRSTLAVAQQAFLNMNGVLADGTALVTVARRPSLRHELWLAPAGATLRVPPPEAAPPAEGQGQIGVADGRFVVADAPGQPWTFNGVHLILPSRGINGSSFSAPVLDDAHATAERAQWLDRAAQIGARTIRIYLDLPGDTTVAPAPRPEQIYRFAVDELAPRGMRVGLVIHNSGRFDDPDGRKMAWLRALLDCFGGGATGAPCRGSDTAADNRTALIGYISADNEINIHRHPVDAAIPGNASCRPDDPAQPVIAEDCFDHPNPAKRAAYVREALAWVALVRDTLRAHPTGRAVLLTVGMSIDLDHDALGDGQSAVLNYFTGAPLGPAATPTALADLVDFLAPHSYTALPYREIVEPIERAAPLFAKPILLEEFGYPTDPILQPAPDRPSEFKETTTNLHWAADGALTLVANGTELPPGEDIRKLCRYLPKLGTFGDRPKRCQPSAPYVVQANLEAIFDMRYFAGGVAFMLADSGEKNDGSRRCYAADAERQLSKNLFLGLFTIDEHYPCGGTVNVGAGQIKNTGYRVCVAFRTGSPQRGNYADRVPECEIDLAAVVASPINRPQPRSAVAGSAAVPVRWSLPTALTICLLAGCVVSVLGAVRRRR